MTFVTSGDLRTTGQEPDDGSNPAVLIGVVHQVEFEEHRSDAEAIKAMPFSVTEAAYAAVEPPVIDVDADSSLRFTQLRSYGPDFGWHNS